MKFTKKKILFVIPEYSHGGTNKSLENLLLFLNKEMYDISIFCLYEDGGDYYKKVFAPYILRKSKLYYWLHDNVFTRKIMGAYNRFTKRDNFTWLYKREATYLQKKHKYDTIIAYQEGIASYFVTYFKDVKRIAWVHYDYGAKYWEKNRINELNLYSLFDNIVCVSNSAAKSFSMVYPTLKDKVVSIYNTINTNEIHRLSQEVINDDRFINNIFNIVSIGRFVRPKQFQLIPNLCKSISNISPLCQFRWYIIAPHGECEEETEKKIKEYNLDDKIVILGAKDNPYPYIANSDLLVCTSATESFSYVIAEAKVLHTPVVTNNFPVAYEVMEKKCGVISPINDMPQILYKLIKDEDGSYSKVKRSVSSYKYNNDEIIKRVISII